MRAAVRAIYRHALGGAVKCQLFCRVPRLRMPSLLQRPGDRAIGRTIGLSVHELVAASVEMAGYCALGGLRAVFSI